MLCFRHAVIVVETVWPVTHENPTKINHFLISPYIKIKKKIWHIRISLGSNKPLIQKKKSISEKKRENENRFDAKVNVVYVTLIEQQPPLMGPLLILLWEKWPGLCRSNPCNPLSGHKEPKLSKTTVFQVNIHFSHRYRAVWNSHS